MGIDGVSMSSIADRWHAARRTRWREVTLTFGRSKVLECPDCGALVHGPQGKALHLDRHRLDHYHDDMPDPDQQE